MTTRPCALPLLPRAAQQTASRGRRHTRGSLAEARRSNIPSLSHCERMASWGRGVGQGLVFRSPEAPPHAHACMHRPPAFTEPRSSDTPPCVRGACYSGRCATVQSAGGNAWACLLELQHQPPVPGPPAARQCAERWGACMPSVCGRASSVRGPLSSAPGSQCVQSRA